MNDTDWIMSEGGPLVCMEPRFETSWGGISGLSAPSDNAVNDYERACSTPAYLASVPTSDGHALVIGDAPLDTAFWRSENGQLFLIRVWFCEDDFDATLIMRNIRLDLFDTPKEQLDFSISSSRLVIFDSAENGKETDKTIIEAFVEPAHYNILTQIYDPDPSCSLVPHRFDRLV